MEGDRAHDRRAGFVARSEQVQREAAFEYSQAIGLFDFVDEAALELKAGGIAAAVVNAAGGMSAFAPGVELAGCVCIEGHAPVDEFSDTGDSFGDDFADDWFIAEPCAGGERVLDMGVDRVCVAEDGGDSALCPGCVGLIEWSFGEDDDLAVVSGRGGGTESGDASSYDEGIGENLGQKSRAERDQIPSLVEKAFHGRKKCSPSAWGRK